jgi:hypothetical protein
VEAYTGIDSVGLFLSGGSSNYDPDDSLGGAISSKLIKGMEPIYGTPVQGLIIEDATPENLEGAASIAIIGTQATYTPPDGQAGSAVSIAAGERKVLTGADADKAVRILRVSGLTWAGTASFDLVDVLNSVFGMGNVPSADRVAGSVRYRAIFVKALQDVDDVICWITTDGQASFALASETPESDGSIQTISDDSTAPSGLSWVNATSESAAIDLGDLSVDDTVGLWIRRTFPAAGTVAAKESVNFHLQFVAG